MYILWIDLALDSGNEAIVFEKWRRNLSFRRILLPVIIRPFADTK